MTFEQLTHLDGRTDRHVDGRIDDCKVVCKDDFKELAIDADIGDLPAAGATVIVLANHNGGVTKTTSTANLGAMLAERGLRVLLIDCDPQANLSEAFGWTEDVVGERHEDLLAQPAAAGRFQPPAALLGGVSRVGGAIGCG